MNIDQIEIIDPGTGGNLAVMYSKVRAPGKLEKVQETRHDANNGIFIAKTETMRLEFRDGKLAKATEVPEPLLPF